MIFPTHLILDTIAGTSFTVSLACRDRLARTSGSPVCSNVDFSQDWPVCELRTLMDTMCLGSVTTIVGAMEVICYNTRLLSHFHFLS